ncbi:MAG: phage tail length tape measure family protein, partial [Burkholderiaceae bacterium]|nr:phage tail length tape measure family protein [Burkholderiaceae bacterium]
ALHRDEAAARAAAAGQDSATRAADQFIKKLQDQVAVIGMNAQQLQSYRAAQLGVTDAAAPLISKLAETGAGAHGAGVHMETLNFKTVAARRELLVLAHELSQGNYQKFGGSLMVLGEQTGAAGLLFSSAGLAALALTAAVVGVGYAMIKGAIDQKHMNDALIMTGNYAGLTSDSLNALAHDAVHAGGSIGEAKKAVTELAASGKFTGDQIGYIADAVVALEHATGRSIQKMIKDFETLAVQTSGSSTRATEVVSRNALKLDDTYHFLTEAIYEQIRALEKEGDAKGASALATEALARVTKERAEEIIGNLGYVARSWHAVKEAIGGAVDAVGRWGAKRTPAPQIDHLTREIADLRAGNVGAISGVHDAASKNARLAADIEAITKLVIEKNAADKVALDQGATALAESEGKHAASRIFADDVKLQKRGMTELQVALEGYAADVEKVRKSNPDSALITPQAIAEHTAALKKAHTERQRITKPQVDHADNNELANRIKAFEAEAAATRQHYEDQSKLDDMYRRAGELSDQQFYANKRAAAAGIAQAQISAYDNEIAALVAHNNRTKAEAEKTAGEIQAIQAKRASAVERRAAENFRLGEEERLRQKAIESASDDAVNKYIAGLAQEAQKLEESNTGREQSRAAVEREAAARLDLAIAYQSQAIASQTAENATKEEIAQAPQILKYLEDTRAARLRLAAGFDRQETDKSMKKAADQAIQDWKYAGTSIAESLTSAFGEAGKAIGGMFKAYTDGAARQLQVDKDLKASTRGMADNDPEKIKAVSRASRDSAQAQIKSYGDIAGAASGFFQKSSAGYKVLHATEQAFRTFQMAMSLESMIRDVAATTTKTTAAVGAEGVKSAAMVVGAGVDTATTGVSLANSAAKTTASTMAGVAKAFEQMGVWGFVGAAAIIAFMVGMGGSMSGGGGAAPTTFEDRQKTQGTGTVLGDSTAKSDSMARALETVAENSSLGLGYQSSMLASLKNIETSLGGAAKGLFQTAGLTTGSAFGTVNESTKSFFGADTSTTITDSGVKFAGLLGELRRGAGTGVQYEDATRTSDGGWFHGNSSSSSTNTAALSAEVMRPFTLVFDNMGTLLSEAGVNLGRDGAGITEAINKMTVDLSVSTRDLKGQDMVDALSAGVSVAFDKIALDVFPAVSDFQKVGEGMGQTVVRVASGVETAAATLDKLGVKSIKYTDILTRQGDVAAEIVRQSVVNSERLTSESHMEDRVTSVAVQVADVVTGPLAEFHAGLVAMGVVAQTFHTEYKTVTTQAEVYTGALSGIGAIMQDMPGTADELATAYKSLIDIRTQMNNVGLDGSALSASTIRGAGGLSQLSEGLSSYLDNFFTSAEKSAAMTSNVAAQFATLNVAMPTTKEGLRALIEQTGSSTEKTAALTGALIALTPAFNDAKNAALSEENALLDLRLQTYEATGNAAGAAAIREQQHTEALKAMSPAIASATRALWAAEDASKIAETRHSLEIDLMTEQNNVAGALAARRADELKALRDLDPALVKLKQSIYDVKDAAHATSIQKTLTNILQPDADAVASAKSLIVDTFKSLKITMPTSNQGLLSLINEATINASAAGNLTDIRPGFEASLKSKTAFGDDVVAVFDKLHRAVPKTLKDFDAVLTWAEKIGPENTDTLTALNGISGAFKTVQDAADTAAKEKLATSKKAEKDRTDVLEKAEKDRVDAAKAAADKLAGINEGYRQRIAELVKAALPLEQVRAFDIRGMDATTVALYDQFAALQNVADGKKQELTLYNLTHNAAEQLIHARELELAAMHAVLRPMQQQIHAAQDLAAATEAAKTAAARAAETAKTNTDTAFAAVQKAISAEKTRIGVIRDVAAEAVRAVTGVFDLLKDQVSDLYGTVESTATWQAEQGNAFIDQALATVKNTGYLPDQKQLAAAIAAARGGLDPQQFETQIQADRAALVMAGKLAQIQTASGYQLTTAEQSLKIANDQLAALDQQLEYAQRLVDAVHGETSATLSVVDAIAALSASIAAQNATTALQKAAPAPTPAGGGDAGWVLLTGSSSSYSYEQSVADKAAGVLPTITHGAVSAPGTAAGPTSEYDSIYSAVFAAGRLPAFDVGINRVPYDMPALIHKDEAVVPARFNPFNPNASGLGGGNADLTRELVDELRLTREQNEELTQRLEAALFAVALNTLNASDTLDAWNRVGIPAERVDA